jgi:hypothetical protein
MSDEHLETESSDEEPRRGRLQQDFAALRRAAERVVAAFEGGEVSHESLSAVDQLATTLKHIGQERD